MKKLFYGILLAGLVGCTTTSDTLSSAQNSERNDALKIGVIQTVYQAAANNQNEPEHYSIYRFSSDSFKKVLEHFEKTRTDENECSEAIYSLKLVEGNGYGLEDVTNANFFINRSNERVVSQLVMPDGNQSVVEFALQCDQSYCVIDDVFDSRGKSGRTSVKELCPSY